MRIVLVMLRNLQEYILDNIRQLQTFGHAEITVICEPGFFDVFGAGVELVDIYTIWPLYYSKTRNFGELFRDGFWPLCSMRFNALEAYMSARGVDAVVHLENDVLVYKNLDGLFEGNKILMTVDAIGRCIPGIMYIPRAALTSALELFDEEKNDMENWYDVFAARADLCDTLPIMTTDVTTPARRVATRNFKRYDAIFDAAAIGQYLGGVDPRNITGDTVGFINETCVFDYSEYKIEWKTARGIRTPFLTMDELVVPIVNLHIHCKNLQAFMSEQSG